MPICAKCGQENREGARFCDACAAPLTYAPSREQRKTVTVLFCDVTGSTSIGESADPEALRALLARYFERMKAIVEAHGGTVEKFIGDAVMAVFGVPQVHEDDALRAVRAALEMREALPELGVQARIGVHTGEVVTGTQERLATGDAVNVAARLEQAAQPGEILIGTGTLQLIRDCADVEPVEPLDLRGKREPVPAYRLLSVTGELSRRHEAPMVGRDTELQRLRAAFEQAVRDRSCQLFTVLGSAGVGKSRLVYEFLNDLDAIVARGHCLSYGEGITYWPLVEVLAELDGLPADPLAAAPLRALLGESDVETTADEIAWAFRKLLEERATDRPLVCVLDDVHWAENTLLDLVEHVADLTRDAPLLLLCMARTEFLDRRPSWGGGKLNATTLLLEPLSSQETEELVRQLGGADSSLEQRILETSEGNPLFVEEMLALAREAPDGAVRVPPTIQAVLAARLDQLDPAERDVLERGSIEGAIFHHGAVQALAPDEAQLAQRLVALVRKELVRPHKAQLLGHEAFRFRHLLIRDAAYDALPKATRAELHERFAAWVEAQEAELVELDELLGLHLSRAARYKAELGRPDAALSERAGACLATAGRRAFWRGDVRAARPLLEQALELTRPLRFDLHLELDLADALQVPEESAATAEAAAERAHKAGDYAGEALARVVAEDWRWGSRANQSVDAFEQLCRSALPLLEREGDDLGLARVWAVLGFGVANTRNQFDAWAEAAEQSLHCWRRAGRTNAQAGLPFALVYGPRPADSALETLDALLGANPHPTAWLGRASLRAMLGEFEEAWAVALTAAQRLRELNGDNAGDYHLALIAGLAGDDAVAADYLQRTCEALEARGHAAVLSTHAPWLARHLCALGRFDEAERWAELGRELGDDEDVSTQMLWRQALALVQSHRAEHADAERLAREAVTISNKTDALNAQADVLCDLAGVLDAAGRTEEAVEAFEQALERYERKKNLAMVARMRPRLEALRAEAPSDHADRRRGGAKHVRVARESQQDLPRSAENRTRGSRPDRPD